MEPGKVTYLRTDVRAAVEVGLSKEHKIDKKGPFDMPFDVYHDHPPPYLS